MNLILRDILNIEHDKINVDEVYDDYFINRRYGTIGRECKWSRGTEDSNIARELGLSGGREGIPACPTYTEEEFDIVLNFLRDKLEEQFKIQAGLQPPINTFVFDCHGERGPEYQEFEKVLIELKKEYPNQKFICMYNDWREFDTEFKYAINLNYWLDILKDNKTKKISNSHKRKKLFISKNRSPNINDSRKKWVDFMKKNNLLEDAFYSIGWEDKFIEDDVSEDIIYGELKKGTSMNGPDDYKLIPYYENVFTEIITTSMIGYEKLDVGWRAGKGYHNDEKIFRPFLMGVIPMILSYPNIDVHLKDIGFDMFDDVLDTSFYKLDDVEKQFQIIKENLKIIKSDLTIEGRFRDDIWVRLENNREYFLDKENIKRYLLRKIL